MRGRKTYIEKSVPEIGDLELGCDVRSPIESLEECQGD